MYFVAYNGFNNAKLFAGTCPRKTNNRSFRTAELKYMATFVLICRVSMTLLYGPKG